MRYFAILLAVTAVAAPRPAVEDKVKDRFAPAPYGAQQIGGMLGERLRVNLEGRLLHVDEAALLAGFQSRPGKQAWIGEHAGKFLHAAANTYEYSRDERLKALMDRIARALVAAQLPDGYLGTYTDDKRWTSWDVWVHKYDLIGLLSYYKITGWEPALDASRKIGDLLGRTFGDTPGQRDIIQSSTHIGMAAMSVLEPMVELYRYTGEKRYLDFCRYITRAYDQPNGPKIVSSLLETHSVYKTANAKAYEMMSNLVGLVELYRATGDEQFLKPALIAWDDIRAKRLYITGTTSSHEHFKDDFVLPGFEAAAVGEGCATVTWLQLGWELLRVTGEAKYAEELERTVYNQLLGAQDPHNGNICYFTALTGKKPYGPGVNCCVSSEPRGISMIPQLAWGTRDKGVAVLLYVSGEIRVELSTEPAGSMRGGRTVGSLAIGDRGLPRGQRLKSETTFPSSGDVALTVESAGSFPLYLRVPEWTKHYTAKVDGKTLAGRPGEFLAIERDWKPGDRVDIRIDMEPQLLPGGASYPKSVAIRRGPQVLAVERAVNPDLAYLHLTAPKRSAIRLREAKAPGWWGSQVYALDATVVADGKRRDREVLLVPFADANEYTVWLSKPEALSTAPVAVTALGKETWSRAGDIEGSICDERTDTFRRALGNGVAKEDWYAVEMTEPREIRRVVFRHGKVFDNGGWFDTSAGKPRIEIKRAKDSPWESIATLDSYPSADSSSPPQITDGQPFEMKLAQPVRALAIRIAGKPARDFSSCAELSGYDR